MNYQDTLSKVKALINSPNKEESDTARRLYNKLKEKYNLEDIDEDCEKKYEFKVGRTHWKRKLFSQVAYMVTDNGSVKYYTSHPSVFIVKTTENKAFEIDFTYKFYCKVFEKDLKLMISAFIHKHKIFPLHDEEPDDNSPQYTNEEIAQMIGMMSSLSNDTCHFHKALESKREK